MEGGRSWHQDDLRRWDNFYFSLCLNAEISVHVVNSREGIKDERLPTEQPTPNFVWFVPSTRTMLAKAVYLVLGSSWCLGTSITLCIN